MAQLTIKDSAGTKLKKSVRFAADPLGAGAFSAGMLVCNGTTVSSIASRGPEVQLPCFGRRLGRSYQNMVGTSEKTINRKLLTITNNQD